MTFGSLFAGIGGLDLGLERAGMKCVWQVENDSYATKVLEKHWPHVKRWDDVRTFPPEGEWGCDLICGGFPCQDISNAGKRAGIEGSRSGLWSEFSRIVCVVRPQFVLVENVAALLSRGMERVLGDLAACGYDAEWSVLSSCRMGFPHTRERVFILAYPNCGPCQREQCGRIIKPSDGDQERNIFNGWSQHEPPRVASRLPNQLDRNRCVGATVQPQVAQWIGERIMEATTSPS